MRSRKVRWNNMFTEACKYKKGTPMLSQTKQCQIESSSEKGFVGG